MAAPDTVFRWTTITTAVGDALIVAGPSGVRAIVLRASDPVALVDGIAPGCVRDDTGLRPVAEALAGLIDGSRTDFPHPVDLEQGTPFQRAVWKELTRIGHGETITYAELAGRVGRPKAIRAVGQANGANPLPVVVPCHRVVAANGKLGGYTGGVDIKEHLLFVEGLR